MARPRFLRRDVYSSEWMQRAAASASANSTYATPTPRDSDRMIRRAIASCSLSALCRSFTASYAFFSTRIAAASAFFDPPSPSILRRSARSPSRTSRACIAASVSSVIRDAPGPLPSSDARCRTRGPAIPTSRLIRTGAASEEEAAAGPPLLGSAGTLERGSAGTLEWASVGTLERPPPPPSGFDGCDSAPSSPTTVELELPCSFTVGSAGGGDGGGDGAGGVPSCPSCRVPASSATSSAAASEAWPLPPFPLTSDRSWAKAEGPLVPNRR